MVEQVCGVPREQFLEVAEALCANSGRERTSAFCYAVGWTQHTVGVQYIRTAAIIQLLLGNIGRPGGGILALRGHAIDPGLDRHPDALQHPARLPPDAARRRRTTPSHEYVAQQRADDRRLGRHADAYMTSAC